MRAGQDTEWTIFQTAIIQMDTHRHHLFQNLGRWMHMRHTVLHRPAEKAGRLDVIGHRNGGILMPRDFPVRLRGFIEERGAHRKGISSESGISKGLDCACVRQYCHNR